MVDLDKQMDAFDTAEQVVNGLELRRYQAMIEADVSTLAQMFADELVYSHSDGGRDTKSSLLDKIASGQIDYIEAENPDQQIAVVGHTAIVTGRMVAHLRVAGATRRLNNRCLSVWAHRDREWSFLAFQPTVLPLT